MALGPKTTTKLTNVVVIYKCLVILKLTSFLEEKRTFLKNFKGLQFKVPENSENKPRGLYFSKALFEGVSFGGAYIRRGLSTEGNLRFEIDWAGLIVGSKLLFLLCFTLYLSTIFQVQAPGGRIFGGAI